MDTSNSTLLTAMQSEWGTAAVFIFAVLLGVFIVISAIGNLMVMVAIFINRRHCDRGCIFIYNLSLVDFLTAVCVMPLSLVTLLKGDFIFSNAVCQFNGFTVQVLFITSIHTLMYMAVYRFMSISSPFMPISLYKIGVMVAASWLWALIVSSLSMDVLSSFLYKRYTTQCGPTYPTDTYGWVNVAIVAGACFIIPLGVIVCIYVLLFRKANRLFSRLQDPNYTNYSHEAHIEQRRLSITFIIIVVGFIICWSPIFIYLNYASLVKDKAAIPTTINPIGDAARMQMEADDGHIKLTYKHDGNTSVITFLCNKGLPDKQVSFLWTDPVTKTHYFQWTTSLVCPPLEKECTRMVHDKEYDFSSLIRHDTNYLAHKYSGELYYINICHRVLATGPARHCPAGAAVCVASGKTSNRTYHSLGRLGADNPITGFGESAVYIQYTDGDTCPTDHSKKLTSLIMMRCNPDRQVVGEVEAAGSSQQCRQDFILETSAACPVKASATTIKPPTATCGSIGGLDTAALRKQYKVESPHHTYYLNFCGATTGDLKSCNGNSEFGVCQVSKDSSHEQVLAGKPTSSGVQVEGRIVFNFTDGKICAHDPRNSPRNVVLTLHCNQFASSDSEPEFYGEDAADCTYHMGWGRPELCSPEQVSCSVSHNGHIVDLSALADEIHFAFPSGDLASEYEGKQYLVSVCKPLKAAAINKCPGASVCQTSSAGHQAIGYVHSSPRVVDGDKENWGIELVYNTTTHCSGFSDKTVTSIIKFTCGGYKGAPDLMDTDGCTYTFLWLTSEACDEDANSQSSADCKIKNPKTDDVIDLSPLKGHIFQEDSYKLAVCGSLPSSDRGSCPDGTAVCVGGNTSAGKFSDMQLNRHGDDVILQYSGGSSCRGSTGAGTITTMIQFVCDPSAGAGKPNMEINFDSCIHNFHWKTAYVCAADCTFDYMGQIYDFRHLSSHNQPHSLSSHGYQFKMDICRDLPISDGGSEATCVSVEKGGKKYPIAYTSTLVPHYWGEGRLALTYTGTDDGHICPTAAYKPNVLLKLTCHNSLGKPSFVKLASNCTFIFEWNTYVACHDDARSKVDVVDGIFTDPVSSLVFNISQHLNHKVEVNEANYTYAISIKNALHDSNHQNCDDGNTHACQYKPSFSRAIGKNVESYYYQDEELQLVLNSDSTCGRLTSIKAQTLINFLCNDKAPNDSRPTFIDETHSCRYLFEWESPALCRPVSTSTTAKLSGGAIAGIVIGVLVCIVVVVVIVTYKVKRRRRWDGTYEYTGLSTDDDTTMLVTANKHASPRYYNDDDDDMVI